MTVTSLAEFSASHSGIGTSRSAAAERPQMQSVVTALQLLQVAMDHLQTNQLDQAEMALDQIDASGFGSTWVVSAAGWVRSEIQFATSGSRIGVVPEQHRRVAATETVASTYALTDRENEVLELLSRGFSSKQIARELFISNSTVAYHLGNMYAKTGVTSRHQLSDLLWQDSRQSA